MFKKLNIKWAGTQHGFGRADANDGEAEAGAEAAAGDGLRRTRRPRAATRNISELLADAEDSFGEEGLEAEPEPDSEQGAPLPSTGRSVQVEKSADRMVATCNMLCRYLLEGVGKRA